MYTRQAPVRADLPRVASISRSSALVDSPSRAAISANTLQNSGSSLMVVWPSAQRKFRLTSRLDAIALRLQVAGSKDSVVLAEKDVFEGGHLSSETMVKMREWVDVGVTNGIPVS